MKRFALIAFSALALVGCATTAPTSTPVGSIPGAAPVCAALHSDKFDLALKAYGAAVDAVNLLVDAKVLKPGSPKAVAVADANDKVLTAFATAERARAACDATSYAAALAIASTAIADIRNALHS